MRSQSEAAGRRSDPSTVAGHYSSGSAEVGARVDVFVTGPTTIRVVGRAYRGSSKPFGPNTGRIDLNGSSNAPGVFDIRDDNVGSDRQMRIRLEFFAGGLEISEENGHGYFGMNVTFAGIYRRLGDARWPCSLAIEDI